MALKLKRYINSCGVEVESGYFEIYEVIRNYDLNTLGIRGRIYLSKELKDEGFSPIDVFEDVITVEKIDGDYRKFAYKYILDVASRGLDYILDNCPLYKGFIGAEVI